MAEPVVVMVSVPPFSFRVPVVALVPPLRAIRMAVPLSVAVICERRFEMYLIQPV